MLQSKEMNMVRDFGAIMGSSAEVTVNSRLLLQLSSVAIICIVLVCVLQCRMRTTLRGATVWPLIGILPSMLFHFGRLYDWFTYLATVNGGTFRFPGPWKTRIMTADPANIEYMLKTRYHNFGKGEFYKDMFRDFFGDSVLVQDGERFRLLNKSAAMALSSAAFRDSVATTLPVVMHQKLLPVFSHACEKGTVIDLQDVFLRLAFDNVCIFGGGVDLGSLSPDLPRVPFMEAFDEAIELVMIRMLLPPFCWKTLRFFNIGGERRLRKATHFVHAFVNEELYPRWRAHTGPLRADIASAFIRFERESGRLYSDKRMHELFVNLIFAGKDTVAAGLTWFFWLLAQHPRVEAKILAELRGINASFTFEEIKKMDYLQAALSESLRLYPPVPAEITEAAQDDVLPDGTPVDKGALLFYSIYSSGRLESVWGNDCLEFKPERWMKNDRYVRESDFKFAAFNGGPRRCTGREFAYWQMKWAVASILFRYRVKIVDEHKVVSKFGLALFMKYGLLATIHPRNMENHNY